MSARIEQHPPSRIRLRVGQSRTETDRPLERLVDALTGGEVEVHDRAPGHAGG